MTPLYQGIEINLWKKDMPRLYPNTAYEAFNCRIRLHLLHRMPGDIAFLQYIAFSGFRNNVSDFTWNSRDQIYHYFPNMTSSDSSSSYRDQDYYFFHQTFQ
jgi:hypothetical protein